MLSIKTSNILMLDSDKIFLESEFFFLQYEICLNDIDRELVMEINQVF